MKNTFSRIATFIAILLCTTFSLWAQSPHSTPESRQRMKERADYGIFRRQAAALKEFAEERKKIPALQKENKETVKVFVTVDSVDNDDTAKNKVIQGYIVQQIGENTANAYELTFDRAQRKITTVKRTGESADPEAEPKEKKESTAAKKPATAPTKATPKKKKDPDGDDEDEEEEKEEKTPSSKEKDE